MDFSLGYSTSGALAGHDHFEDSNHNPWHKDQYPEAVDRSAYNAPATCRSAGSENSEDMSWLEYAKYHGLATNHRLEGVSAFQYPLSPPLTSDADLQDFPTSAEHTVFDLWSSGCMAQEKWNVDLGSAELIASLLTFEDSDYNESWTNLDDRIDFKNFKIEEPALTLDPTVDLQRLRQRNQVSIDTSKVEPFVVDEYRGEGLAWSEEELSIPAEQTRRLENEKLDIDEDAAKCLKECIFFSDDDSPWIEPYTIDGKSVRSLRPITPPLLPLSPEHTPTKLAHSAAAIQLTSTPEDLIAEEAADLERGFLSRDTKLHHRTALTSGTRSSDDVADYVQDTSETLEPNSPSPEEYKRLRDLEVDVPLLSQAEESLTRKDLKAVSFPKALHSALPAPELDAILSDPQEDIEAFFNDVVEPLAYSAIDQVENEELLEIDTTMRVKVPSVEDFELLPTWRAFGRRALAEQRMMLVQIRNELAASDKIWAGAHKIERKLPWSPFPTRLAKINIHETCDNGSLARYMKDMPLEELIDIEPLVCGSFGGLRLLQEDDSDCEDLEPTFSTKEDGSPKQSHIATSTLPASEHVSPDRAAQLGPPRMDRDTLLQRRKLELEIPHGTSRLGSGTKRKAPDEDDNRATVHNPANPTSFGNFSTGAGLSSFLRLHGAPSAMSNLSSTQQISDLRNASASTVKVETTAKQDKAQPPVLPSPAVPTTSAATSIVVSSGLMANHRLVLQIQHHLPNAEIVARDPLKLPLTSKQAVQIQEDTNEADITFSPSAGLILTTLQKLKQKPLPGNAAFFGVNERIEAVSPRYERLIVLVSEGSQRRDDGSSEVRSMDERDASALSDLVTSVTARDTDIEVCYVAGGEHELADWAAAVIAQNAAPGPEGNLLQDETCWEQFLRAAGMNAFAAQAVLSRLKAPESCEEDLGSSSVSMPGLQTHGLARFIDMSHEERLALLGVVVGGERVANRINDVVGKRWMSVSGGL